MTAVDLDALDAARAAATGGEWSSQENRIYARGYRVATVVPGGAPGAPEADTALIVAAVNNLPALIAAARERDALREAVLDLADDWQRYRVVPSDLADRLRAVVAAVDGGKGA